MRDLTDSELSILRAMPADFSWPTFKKYIERLREEIVQTWAHGGNAEYYRGGYNILTQILDIPETAEREIQGRQTM